MATYTDASGKTYDITYGDYMQNFNVAKQQSDEAAAKKQQQLQQTLADNNKATNANYDSSARQAYIQYMQNRKQLPSQLQTLGVNGGATETALMNLYNNYGTNHATNETARNQALATNQQNYNDTWNSYEEARRADLDAAFQTALTNQQNQYNNEITQFSSTVQQFPSTKAGYNQYNAWINALAASNDPLKDIKISIVRQQMATQFPNGVAGLSSGSGSGGGSSYSGSTKNSNNTKLNSTQKNAVKVSSNVVKNAVKNTVKAANAKKQTKVNLQTELRKKAGTSYIKK